MIYSAVLATTLLASFSSRPALAEGELKPASWAEPDAQAALKEARAGAAGMAALAARETPPVWMTERLGKGKPSLEEALWTLEHSPERQLYRDAPVQIVAGSRPFAAGVRNLVWHPAGPIEIEVSDRRGGWIERIAIMESPIARAAYNLTAKQRTEEHRPWGGPPSHRAVSPREAVELLAGMDGAAILEEFEKGLRSIRKFYSASR
ncbi:MAG: hypothetical protein HY554_01835 [Elusimicrobia bacterium]|nr:hypothetical protein [Elusimicrobiota bacterium]